MSGHLQLNVDFNNQILCSAVNADVYMKHKIKDVTTDVTLTYSVQSHVSNIFVQIFMTFRINIDVYNMCVLRALGSVKNFKNLILALWRQEYVDCR
jgi:hypothetical protein